MKTAETAYMARCEDCNETYGFVSPAERDGYLSTWHGGHQVTRTAESLT